MNMQEPKENIARILEHIEKKELSDLHEAAPDRVRRAMGLVLEDLDGVFVSVAPRGGDILLNRTIGLGMHSPATPEQVAEIRRIYEVAGVARYFVHADATAEPRPISALLEQAGLLRDRAWMRFARGTEPADEPVTDLEIREIGADHALDFGRIAADAFGLPETAWPAVASLAGRPGWHVYMSFEGNKPAGTGSLFVQNGVGWTDWGATMAAFRRRGSQSALLARRVNAARELGCSLIGTCTGEAVADEDQNSYRNIRKAGFREIGLRENFSPTGRPG
jgi:GNAT superfamily N-acetyltransferase